MSQRRSVSTLADPLVSPIRCAIYTRKSTEEGLEQEFNSLDAQRESAESFIVSQRQNGWLPVEDRYDDGGYSGSTLDRPALQRLIQGVEAGKIQCVVVYKIDRLSRSLLDFTRLIDLFERYGVSFVSVTQQFNTTTSMGRLTLNILLSFAQFEREIIGERIRDKIAAAKRKGKYTGGPCVLGYDVDRETHRLVVNPGEAELVRHIFERFVEIGSPQNVAEELNDRKLRTKTWITGTGNTHEGVAWNAAALYRLLHNHLYVGEINHKGNVYPGEHQGIVSRVVWDKAQAMLVENDRTQGNRSRTRHDALLRGLLRCGHCGCGMTHSFARKNGKLYRYYVCVKALKNGYASCPLKTLPAGDVEQAVLVHFRAIFRSPSVVAQTYREAVHAARPGGDDFTEQDVAQALEGVDGLWENLFPSEQTRIAQLLAECVTVTRNCIDIELRPNGMRAPTAEINMAQEEVLRGKWMHTDHVNATEIRTPNGGILIRIPVRLRHRSGRKEIVAPLDTPESRLRRSPENEILVMAILRAHSWFSLIESGRFRSVPEIAAAVRLDRSYVSRLIELANLAPDIILAVLNGNEPDGFTLQKLRKGIPLLWEEQRKQFGFPAPN